MSIMIEGTVVDLPQENMVLHLLGDTTSHTMYDILHHRQREVMANHMQEMVILTPDQEARHHLEDTDMVELMEGMMTDDTSRSRILRVERC
jgi:hypothetical protein